MSDTTSRTALLEDPQLRPFLPLLWVAWSDGDMEEDEFSDLCLRVRAMPWLRPAARIALTGRQHRAPPARREDLLAGFKRRFEGHGFGGVARHFAIRAKTAMTEKNAIAARRTAPAHLLRDRGFHLAALRYREESLLETAAARLRKRITAKMPVEQATLEVQEHLVALAKAHAERLTLEWFDATIVKIEDATLRALLDSVGALHGITVLRADAGFHIGEGYFEPTKESALRRESDLLIRELLDSAVGLVDAFGIPDACLAAPIAFMDPAHPAW